ncbi:hypothetical protein ACWDHW_23415 [Streptomyces melanosporofaciens]|uniref:hypothetical protein n=1 Tax=Streptomyces sp. NPDC021218 TaxID=3365119 RepID=UPI0037A4E3DA
MKRKLSLAVLASTVLMLAGALPASATSGRVGPASLRQDEWVNYTTQRTITANSSNIYVRKSNGPKLEIKWRRCAGGAQGSPVTLPDSDPTDVIRIGQDFLSGTVFCLSARSRGSNETDTWEGIVWWNIHQTPDVPGSAIP